MPTNKTYLKLHKPQVDNVMGLFGSRYEVVRFEYQFEKPADKLGLPRSYTRAGSICVIVKGLPTEELLRWMFDIRKFDNGELTTHNTNEEVLDKIYFEQGRLVGLRVVYDKDFKTSIGVQLTINAGRMMLGETTFESNR